MIRVVTTCEVRPRHDIPAVYSWVIFFYYFRIVYNSI